MTLELWLALGGLFVSIALLTGLGVSVMLAGRSTEQRRLREMATPGGGVATLSFGTSEPVRLTERINPRLERIAKTMPKSPKEMSRLRRRLALAGIQSFGAAVFYAFAELTLPFLFAAPALMWLIGPVKWIVAIIAGLIGYMIPGLILARLIHNQKRRIENGLPDALDLMIVCVEAGCGLDQAILKTSIELEISHPELAAELRMITTEVRAGKNRMEAFKNFAARTKVDDVRSLVAMLVQTDRFGTSIAQALRTHAETSRTKRRQRAEEKAAKIGVKLVFPLVFFLFPAFYVVTLGPAVIQFVRVFFGQVVNR
jgi:tight adherence protein C